MHTFGEAKTCVKCGELKEVKFFGKDSRMTCGFESQCKSCRKIAAYKNPKTRAHARRWANRNRGQVSDPSQIRDFSV